MPKRIFQSGGGGKKGYGGFPVSQFIALSDCPASYAGAGTKFVTVKAGENGLEFTPLPPLAITDTFVVGSQAAMLALTAQTGDVAIRTDINQSFILQGSDPAILANWVMLLVSPSHAIGGALHTADTLANLKTKISAPDFLITSQAAEINGLTAKTPPANADIFIIEDSADTNKKKKITLSDILSLPIIRNLETIIFPEQYRQRNVAPPIVEMVNIGAYYKIVACRMPKAEASEILIIIPVPSINWNKLATGLDINIALFSTTTPAAGNDTVRIGAKVWAEPDGTITENYDFTGLDTYGTNTFPTKYTQQKILLQNMPVNRITAAPLAGHGMIFVKIARDYLDAGDTLNWPIFCPFVKIQTYKV